MQKFLHFITLLVCMFLASDAFADFRCKGKSIRHMSSFDVLALCGEPLHKESFSQSRGKYHQCTETQVWYYISPTNRRSVGLHFREGKVAKIEEGIIRTNL